VSEKGARALLGVAVAAMLLIAASVDLPDIVEHRFWSDGATYYAMALSLAEDRDLRYEARDVLRVRREFGSGPEGIFLKRSSGGLALSQGFPWLRRIGADEPRIYYAKAFAYPLAIVPFVRVFGTDGMLVGNAFFLGLAYVCSYAMARRRAAPAAALALATAVLFGCVTPIYVFWLQPEVFNLAMIAGGLLAWLRGWPLVSALLLGVATYSKPTHLFLALPLGLQPLLVRGGAAFLSGLRESIRRGLVLGAVTASFWGANVLITGEWNYQGGERKTFYEEFPFETPGVTFGNSGIWMTTNQLGPVVEGDDTELLRGEGVPLAGEELRQAFLHNLGYFWYGRYGGALPYFFPVVLAALLFLWPGPRDAPGWLALASLAVSWIFYIWLIPANWYGGGGTVGNRYFVSLVPLAFLLTPRGREWVVSMLGLAVSLVFVGPILAAPIEHSIHPDRHALRAPFKLLPAELTMLNDLSANIASHRKKIPFGDMGDLGKNWPADPKAYWLYFPDDGTYGKDVGDGRECVRARPGERAELLLRALEPVKQMSFAVSGGAAGDRLEVRVDGTAQQLELDGRAERRASFQPARGLLYYDSFVHVIRLESQLEGAAPARARERGPLVCLTLEVEKRARR
jgi:hypothetical protein